MHGARGWVLRYRTYRYPCSVLVEYCSWGTVFRLPRPDFSGCEKFSYFLCEFVSCWILVIIYFFSNTIVAQIKEICKMPGCKPGLRIKS